MQLRVPRAAALVLGAVLAAGASAAEEVVLDQPIDPEAWPTEITRRPISLGEGMFELTVPASVNLTAGNVGKPVSVAPSVYFGVTSRFSIGVRHARGLCVTGVHSADGPGGLRTECRKLYDDVTLDTIWRFASDVAFGLAVTASPLSDPVTALSGEARFVARFSTGPLAVTVVPTLSVGFNDRDTPGIVRVLPVGIPLATYTYGGYFRVEGNREYVVVPLSLTAALIPSVAFSVGGAIHGPPNRDFSERYVIPVGGALVVTPDRHLDVGASFTFANLLGKHSTGDERGVQIFASVRI